MWGYFFKAETWEDLKIMENNYPIIGEAASIVYNAVNDKAIRDRIEARADYERRQRTLQRQITSQKEIIASQKEEINSQKEEIASQKEELASQKEKLASQKEELASQEGEISVLQEKLYDKDKIIAELKNQLKRFQS
jgi:chromosome segregation ATPase